MENIFKDFLNNIENSDHREKFAKVLTWIETTFPNLKPEYKWNHLCIPITGLISSVFPFLKNT